MILLVFRVFLVFTFLEITLAKTCDERLENLENLFDSLQLKLEDQAFANNGLGNSGKDALKMKLEKEKRDLERRVVSLEEALTDSNRQMHLLKARVSELERKNQKQETRLATVEMNNRVFEMKSSKWETFLNRNAQKQTKQIEIANENDSPPNPFGRSSSNGEDFSETKGELPTTKIKHEVPVQGYSQMDDVPNVVVEKRGLQRSQSVSPGGVAFTAYVSTRETELSKDHTIKFDSIVTNIGNHYNPFSGIFIAPQHGVYVFTWNLYCKAEGYIYSHVVVNANAVGGAYTSAYGATDVRTTTGIVVVEVNQGDVVFVRTHPLNGHNGNLFSGPDSRSSFNGWKLF
ncbi:collagen alpha-1(X) chain-like [Ostrea edulis]|uniref:collagen alpha-1(X) chain-like n=1 Tax=Ostrea edulis TaxID=37623 RepID=UPI0024AFB924|nr:collagen alpha-1(X) chain-like [Ostrea edulis]